MAFFNTNSATNAILLLCNSDATLVGSFGAYVCEHEEYNTDANISPWIGIYSPTMTIDPFRSNPAQPFKGVYEFPVIVQTSNLRSPADAIRELSELTAAVYDAVMSDRTLKGTVNMVLGANIDPYNRVIESEDALMADRISVIAEVF